MEKETQLPGEAIEQMLSGYNFKGVQNIFYKEQRYINHPGVGEDSDQINSP